MKMKKMAWPAAAVLAVAAAGLVVGEPWAGRAALAQGQSNQVKVEAVQTTNTAPAEGAPTAKVSPQAVAPAQELSQAFRRVHEAVESAVVNINAEKRITPRSMQPQIPEQFRRFFGPEFGLPMPQDNGGWDSPANPQEQGDQGDQGDQDQGDSGKGNTKQAPLQAYATGSGVIIRPDGYIVTNNHVVEGAEALRVKLADGREFDAKVIGRDPKTDLAVIKIDAPNLTYAKWGDSKKLQVGDWVLAFGSPFGFAQTMTQGIISAKGRTNLNIIGSHNQALQGLTYEDFLQTDAAINPGNSGGPLVDLQGDVVGINTAIASRSGAYNGIGFAIPSDEAQMISSKLIASGKVVRGYLGIQIGDLAVSKFQQAAKSVGFDGTRGVFVSGVEANTPAGQAGVKPGDVITELNGKPITDFTAFRAAIARTSPGDKVDLTVVRSGKSQKIEVTVGTQPDSLVALAGQPSRPGEPTTINDLGIRVAEQGGKVVITAVNPQGELAAQGIRPGDTVLSVQGQQIKSVEDLQAALQKKKPNQGMNMIVRSKDGSEKFVFLEGSD